MKYKHFYDIIQNELLNRGWSYRDAQNKIGVQKDVFTRLKQGLNIDLISFLLLIQWLNLDCKYDYNKLMSEIL